MALKRLHSKIQNVELDETTQLLFKVVKLNDVGELKKILGDTEKSLDLDVQDEVGNPCLIWAAEAGYLQIVQLLLDNGASVNQMDFYGQTALHMATEFGHTEVVRLLIKNGADINWMGTKNDGLSPMHVAACKGQTEVAKILIDAGCDINAEDSNGISLLHCAAANGHPAVVRALIQAGAKLNVVGHQTHRSPLFLACEANNMAIAKTLVRAKANVNITDYFGMTPLCAVCIQNNTSMAEYLIKSRTNLNLSDSTKCYPIHYTARNGNVELTKMLLGHGSDMDVLNNCSEGPLHLAVRMGHVEIIQLLIEQGCDVNLCDSPDSVTALHLAVQTYTEVPAFTFLLQHLLQGGCDLNMRAQEYAQETPLHIALRTNNTKVAKVLLQYGADPKMLALNDDYIYQSYGEYLIIRLVIAAHMWDILQLLMLAVQLNMRSSSWPKIIDKHSKVRRSTFVNLMERRAQIPQEITELIEEMKLTPLTLMRQAKRTVRNCLGCKLYQTIESWKLPLKNFCS